MNPDIDVSQVVLTTARLKLRPWQLTDLDDFFEYASVDGVGQMAGWLPHKDKEETMGVLQRFINGKKTFAIEHEGKVIGSLGIERYMENTFPEFADKKCRELGYILSKDYWGQGLMPEAVNRVIKYLFEDVGLDAIFCGHFLSNSRSARVQEKCGFHHYAYRVYETRTGELKDDKVNILYKEEYFR